MADCEVPKIPVNGGGEIEARLGDLDLKSGMGGKEEYWKGLERGLIDEGWYMGTDRGGMNGGNRCLLWRA